MPNYQAIQFAYGSVPVFLLLLGILIQNIRQGKREEMLLNSILGRLTSVETEMKGVNTRLSRVEGHLHLTTDLVSN
jgi:hypothetical protein